LRISIRSEKWSTASCSFDYESFGFWPLANCRLADAISGFQGSVRFRDLLHDVEADLTGT
jgi:hypothetical protein